MCSLDTFQQDDTNDNFFKIWTKFKTTHQMVGAPLILQKFEYHMQLGSMRIQETETLDQYIDRFQSCVLKCKQNPMNFDDFSMAAFIDGVSTRIPDIKADWQKIYSSSEHKDLDHLQKNVTDMSIYTTNSESKPFITG